MTRHLDNKHTSFSPGGTKHALIRPSRESHAPFSPSRTFHASFSPRGTASGSLERKRQGYVSIINSRAPEGNAVTDLFLGKSWDLMVAGVARLRVRHGQCPNSCESGYKNPSRRCPEGRHNRVTLDFCRPSGAQSVKSIPLLGLTPQAITCRRSAANQSNRVFRHIQTLLFVACLFAISLTPSIADETTNPSTSNEKPITSDDREHWSFAPVSNPNIPDVTDRTWPRTPIDNFILKRLEDANLSPSPKANRFTLIRRLTFDLTGLPPTSDEITSFANDESADAYERLVDRLLGSTSYGERWAQHWLDLARFAETDGFEHDKIRPDAWKYRDWVIDALNRDLPYDQFVRLQLAGDELAADDAWAQNATRFLLCGPDMPDINLTEERRHNFLNDMTATVGSVFLGLQIGCAQCHDHKFDPVSQLDFYRLRAYFDPIVEFQNRKTVRLFEPERIRPRKSYLMVRGDFRRQGPQVSPSFPRIANPRNDSDPDDSVIEGDKKLGPRTVLANWLTRPDNPLATRIIVNRIWQYHFGNGICRSPSDVGVMGEWPSHPELLDWLAQELPRRNWSLKSLHRLIVSSATYRQASVPTDATRNMLQKSKQQDPDNELLARFPRRRLEGEAIRDAMLAASNQLSQRRGGPGVRPPLPKELLVTLLKNQWPVTPDKEDHRRRSIYLFVRRNLRFPIFQAFDKPDMNASCPRRNTSTIAPQALTLLNSKLSLSAARALAGKLIAQAGTDPSDQVTLCYLSTLARFPTESELTTAVQFLTGQAARLRVDRRRASELAVPVGLPQNSDPFHAAALTDFCLAVFNLNEFVYID